MKQLTAQEIDQQADAFSMQGSWHCPESFKAGAEWAMQEASAGVASPSSPQQEPLEALKAENERLKKEAKENEDLMAGLMDVVKAVRPDVYKTLMERVSRH